MENSDWHCLREGRSVPIQLITSSQSVTFTYVFTKWKGSRLYPDQARSELLTRIEGMATKVIVQGKQ